MNKECSEVSGIECADMYLLFFFFFFWKAHLIHWCTTQTEEVVRKSGRHLGQPGILNKEKYLEIMDGLGISER